MPASVLTARVLHLFAIWMWTAGGIAGHLGFFYFAGMILIAVFLMREHFLVEVFGLERLNEAFFTMNAAVSIVFFITTSLDIAVRRLWT